VKTTVFEKDKFMSVLPGLIRYVEGLERGEYELTVKRHCKKRSLDANAYFWTLMNKLSVLFGFSSVQLYRELIKDVGGNYYIIPCRLDAAERFIQIWESNGLGWVCDDLQSSKLAGYTNIMCYYGSSQYDSAQMSRLIELAVRECRQQGIETATPEELSLLLEEWKGRPACKK